MESYHLHANKVLFERKQNSKAQINDNRPGIIRTHAPTAIHPSNNKGSFASILKEASLNHSSAESKPALVLDDSCTKEQEFQSVKLTYLGGLWVLIELDSLAAIEKFSNHVGVGSWFSLIKPTCNSFISDERIVWVSLEGLPIRAWTDNTFSKVASKWGELVIWEESEESTLSCKHLCIKTKMNEIINESFKLILKGKVHWLRAKELDAWVPKFLNEEYSSDEESSESGEGSKFEGHLNQEHYNQNDDEDVDKVSESSCMKGNDFVTKADPNTANEESPQSKDSFNIYELLQKKKVNIQPSKDSGPSHPHGFTLIEDESDFVKDPPIDKRSTSMLVSRGSILEVMDDLVKVGQAMGYNMGGCLQNITEIIGAQGESLCLDKHLSDHRPIIMYEPVLDYGSSPFPMFHSWFKMEGFDKVVEDTWHSIVIGDTNGISRMQKKLKFLKAQIKTWIKENKKRIYEAKKTIQNLTDIHSIEASELSQKAKVCWSIEGDENSKYFHGITKSKRSQINIRGILQDGDWVIDPNKIEELECPISYEEIKKAVWDCGSDKSPGPDG
ncbi:hypothetical protein Tco_1014762 [Tanacetum coccineum]